MWKLVNGDGDEVKAGQSYVGFRCQIYTINDGVGQPPHKEGSTGKIYTDSGNFYPNVITGMKWIKVEG